MITSAVLQKNAGIRAHWLFESGSHFVHTVLSYPDKLLASLLADLEQSFSIGRFSKCFSCWFKLPVATLKSSQVAPVFPNIIT